MPLTVKYDKVMDGIQAAIHLDLHTVWQPIGLHGPGGQILCGRGPRQRQDRKGQRGNPGDAALGQSPNQ